MMKKLIFSLIALAACIADAAAQTLRAEAPVEAVTQSVYAARNPRTTSSGKICGLLMVHSTVSGLSFEGAVEGDVDHKAGIYYVYMRPGASKVKITGGDGAKLELQLPEIQSKTTYQVTIYEFRERGSLICFSDPSGATVTLISGNDRQEVGTTPIHGNVDVLEGVYTLEVSKRGFPTQIIPDVRIKPGKATKLGTIRLKKK